MSDLIQDEKTIFSTSGEEKEAIHREKTQSSGDKGDVVWCNHTS